MTAELPSPSDASPHPDGVDLPVDIRASTGQRSADGWLRYAVLPTRRRAVEAGRFAAIGLGGGTILLLMPLIHLLGVVFALVCLGVATKRLLVTRVLVAAGGTCPRCEQHADFFVGLGRRRFQLPADVSCEGCGVELTLFSCTPGAS